MNKPYIDKITKEDLNEFVDILEELGIDFDREKFIEIVAQTLKYLNGDKSERKILRVLQDLENKWYESLSNNNPDYSVYDNVYYLCDTWVCWKKYSRQYIKNIVSNKSLSLKSPLGFVDLKSIKDVMRVNSIADLGCGIGYTTATLKEVFNCRVTGTNIRDTKQYKVCEVLRKKVDFDLTDNIEEIGNVDLVFASEYFEHFEKPVEHLKYVIENLKPKYILFANTFGAKSIGHFDIYINDGVAYSGRQISRLFSNTLKLSGYKKVKTNCFNNRPNFYQYGK